MRSQTAVSVHPRIGNSVSLARTPTSVLFHRLLEKGKQRFAKVIFHLIGGTTETEHARTLPHNRVRYTCSCALNMLPPQAHTVLQKWFHIHSVACMCSMPEIRLCTPCVCARCIHFVYVNFSYTWNCACVLMARDTWKSKYVCTVLCASEHRRK